MLARLQDDFLSRLFPLVSMCFKTFIDLWTDSASCREFSRNCVVREIGVILCIPLLLIDLDIISLLL